MLSQVIHSADRKMRPTTGFETSSAKAEPFAAERPKNFQCNLTDVYRASYGVLVQLTRSSDQGEQFLQCIVTGDKT
jgi:hypothetical protein